MKCNTCKKNRGEHKFVVVQFMRKELVMCDECFETSDMKFLKRYKSKGGKGA